jgi:hypothetical protein
LNQNDVNHEETNALYAGNQAVPLYSTPPPPIPYTGQPPHPMANTYTNQYHESMLYAGGLRGRCNKCGMYGHKASDCHIPGSSPLRISKQQLQMPFLVRLPQLLMLIQPQLLLLPKVKLLHPMLIIVVNPIDTRVYVNSVNALDIVKPIVMTVSVLF